MAESRLEFLLRVQNADGGWGYFPGKSSWLEPTAYAVLALQGAPGSDPATDRAWKALSSWQLPDGGWRPSGQVRGATWVSALALTVACFRKTYGDRLERTLHWLMSENGAECSWPMRAASYFHFLSTDVDVSHPAWPWRPGTASWIEPTAQTLIALKKVPPQYRSVSVDRRIRQGEAMIRARRGRDGGWNSGNPNVLKIDVPSYPETTALAILGLQGREHGGLIDTARHFRSASRSSLANAWLDIALRCLGDHPSAAANTNTDDSGDIMLSALQALGQPDGNYRCFQI